MAKMRIVVCLPGGARNRLEEAIAEAMAPFELDHSRGEELDIWDGWSVHGGSDGGGFHLAAGYEDDPRIVHDVSGDGTRAPSLPGTCPGGPREALAFAGIRAEAAAFAAPAWDLWREPSRSHPPAQPRGAASTGPRTTPAEREAGRRAGAEGRAAFDAQPLVAAYREGVDALRAAHRGRLHGRSFLHEGAAESVMRLGRADFAARHASQLLVASSVLTLDGWWCESGEEPVHGACGSRAACPHAPPLTEPSWSAAHRYLEALRGDALLVFLRRHV
ncbi:MULTISPECIES: hypothetical protein [unclassified Streptomyces]|uniref:hypothetical protein n=1 Tax=unclassified Streptomyces TaxID=2593676 RepID=UPI002E0F0EE3|nr:MULTISPECIES: hypothetical protein [unclassified Streptomyces]WSR22026.1 hypothetical protein OG573_24735 [Streptomyces sp. NBC_01205]